ncbi:choice-of-anchor L domain-containing protein, partial [Roseovarius aestuariivivens]|uniref:choice-of-anchor L domain-containing protein n=1 Tax=Roseovarius aestuariivivens TaxID=1888910 RepID=UPI0010811ED0
MALVILNRKWISKVFSHEIELARTSAFEKDCLMPTLYTLTGFVFTGPTDSPFFVTGSELQIQGSDDLSFSFTPGTIGADPLGVPGTLSVTQGEVSGIVLDGMFPNLASSQWSAGMGEITNGTESTQILTLRQDNFFNYVFILSGDPVGAGSLPTVTEVIDFFSGTLTDIPGGLFAPGTPFSPGDVPGALVDPDPFAGTAGPDDLLGFSSNDPIDGQAGNDTIDGGFGNDTILGGAGQDLIQGGAGNDEINSGTDGDTVDGGGGLDIIRGTPEELNQDRINGLDFGDLIIVEGVSTASILEGPGFNEVLIETNGDATPEASFFYTTVFGAASSAGLVVSQDGGNAILQLDPSLALNAGIGTAIVGPQDFPDIGDFLFADDSINPIDIYYVGAVESLALLEDGYSINEISGDSPNEVVGVDRGIFLSSGGGPGTENLQEDFTVVLNEPGDPRLTQTALDAFPDAGETNDASLITFTFDAANLGDRSSISFDVFFGSDEFPEFVDSAFVDIATVYVNGVNYALFNNDQDQPLSITSESIKTPGNFYTNNGDDGSDTDPFTGTFDTEYDGFSVLLNVIAPVQPGINTVTIAVADTGDEVLDSGLFVGNIQGSDFDTSGSFVKTSGTAGNDNIDANGAPQLITLGSGQDTVSGTPQELNGDFISGFGNDDSLLFEGTVFGAEDVDIPAGSAILNIDTDGDGIPDTQVTLEGDLSKAILSYTNSSGNTEVTGQNIASGLNLIGDETDENLVGSANDDTIQGLGGNDTLEGLDANDTLLGGLGEDRMDGGRGADRMVGGQNGDFYLVNDPGDVVIEVAGD